MQLFKAVYTIKHVAGCVLCLCGLAMLVASDLLSDRFGDTDGSDPGSPFAFITHGCDAVSHVECSVG